MNSILTRTNMIIESIYADTESEMTEKIRKYLREWHPDGYGTRILSKGTDSDGRLVTTFKRSTSCD